MNRYNIFNAIHKGLRRMLFEIQLQIQQTDFSDPQFEETLRQLEKVLWYFDQHGEHEDTFIFAGIRPHATTLLDELENDHDTGNALVEEILATIRQFRETSFESEKSSLGSRILFALNEFIAFNLYHMNKEENQLLLVLWQHYSDEEILAMERAIINSISPEILMEESRWMMRSISNKEIEAWLNGLKQSAPQHVYDAFFNLLNSELSQERIKTLQLI